MHSLTHLSHELAQALVEEAQDWERATLEREAEGEAQRLEAIDTLRAESEAQDILFRALAQEHQGLLATLKAGSAFCFVCLCACLRSALLPVLFSLCECSDQEFQSPSIHPFLSPALPP